jgi:CheY-like chemotaxis protein
MSYDSVPVPAIAASELRHRLRTPLNHLIGYSEILLDEYPDFRPGLESLLAEANAMLDSVQELAGGEQSSLPVSVLTLLRERLSGSIARVRSRSRELSAAMPAGAQADLSRIGNAAGALLDSLDADRVERTENTAPSVAGPAEDVVSGAGRILVVDDNELNRDMLSRQLEKQGHQVATAQDGPAALSMLRAGRFDIVLLDVMMPGMNGFEVLASVKRDPVLRGVAVILVSALDEMDSVVRSIEAGAEDYLFKPVNPTLLRARIRSTLDKMRAEETVRRKQRLESIGLLAAGIAHDFNNLLTGIIGHAQLLEQVLTEPEDREMAESILKAGERAAELTRQLLAYSGKAMSQIQTLDLSAVVRECEGLVRASLPKKVTLEMRPGRAPAIMADPNQIRQSLVNLTLNAAEAIGPDGRGTVTISTGSEQVSEGAHFDVMPDEGNPVGRYAWLEVRDTGCGMDAATVGKIFEPFFTTKFLGRGLGLAAVAGIVRSHQGLMRVNTSMGQGTAMRLYFPAISEASENETEAADAGPFILVVDDETVVRQIVKVALERAGRKVLLADSGEAALGLFQRLGDRIDLILLDWKMPVMDGGETLARLREMRPGIRIIVSSGFAQVEAEERFRDCRISGYLQKPYRMTELTSLVNSLLEPR